MDTQDTHLYQIHLRNLYLKTRLREIAVKKKASINQRKYAERIWTIFFHVYILGKANETKIFPKQVRASWNIL